MGDEGRPSGELERERAELTRRIAAIDAELSRRLVPPTPPTPPTIAPPPAPGQASLAPLAPPTGYAPDRAAAVERFVGSRLVAALGALVTLLAVGIFVKFAYDNGWLGALGALGRLTIAYCFAGALLLAGELAARRHGRAASVGLSAAGVGSMFVATVVGAVFLAVLRGPTGLLATMGVTVIGLVVTTRSRSLLVAIVSLLAAYATPIFLDAYRQQPELLAIHFTLTLGTALALSFLAPRPFRVLRYVALPLQFLVAVPLAAGPGNGTLTLVAVGIWWAMVAGECMLAAWRGLTPRSNAVTSVLATVLVAVLSVPAIAGRMAPTEPLAYTPALVAILAGAASLLLRGPRVEDALGDDERTLAVSMQLLSRAFLAEALAMVPLAASPFLNGLGIAVGWSVAAVLLIEAAWRMAVPSLRVVAGLLVLLAVPVTAIEILPRLGPTWPDRPDWDEIAGAFHLVFLAWAPALLTLAAAWGAWREPAPDPARPRRAGVELFGVAAALAWLLTIGSLCTGHFQVIGYALPLLVVPAAVTRHGRRWLAPRIGGFLLGAAAILSWLIYVAMDDRQAVALPTAITSSISLLVIAVSLLWFGWGAQRPAVRSLLLGAATCWLVAATGIRSFTLAPGWRGGDSFLFAADVTVCAMASVAFLVALGSTLGGGGRWLAVLRAAALALVATGLGWVASGAIAMLAGERSRQGILGLDLLSGLLLVLTSGLAVGMLRPRQANGIDAPLAPDRRGLSPLQSVLAVAASLAFLWTVSIVLVDLLSPHGAAIVHPALSSWWGIYGIALIAIGFARQRAWLRWAGLGVLGLVFVKVLIIDLAQAATIWRVVALLVVGLALVATSVAYVRLRPESANPRA